MKRAALSVHLGRPALVASRELVQAKQVAYIMVANAPLRYRLGASRVAYIGTTYTGFWRLASSTAERASRILRQRGVSSFEVVPVKCQPRPGLSTWRLLERSLLSCFRERYGELPRCNSQGGSFSDYFNRSDLYQLLSQFECAA